MAPFVLSILAVRIRLGTFAPLLDAPWMWTLACQSPWLFEAGSLHLAGLHALDGGCLEEAGAILERAAARYRADLQPECLARVRVHQLMARALAGGGFSAPLSLEVDRALTRLDHIESPTHPFTLVPAHSLVAGWAQAVEPGSGPAGTAERLAA